MKAVEFSSDLGTSGGGIEDFYGIHLDPDPARSIAELLSEWLREGFLESAETHAGDVMAAACFLVARPLRL